MGSSAEGRGVRGRDEEVGAYDVNVWVRLGTMAGVVSVGRCVCVCVRCSLRQSYINHL